MKTLYWILGGVALTGGGVVALTIYRNRQKQNAPASNKKPPIPDDTSTTTKNTKVATNRPSDTLRVVHPPHGATPPIVPVTGQRDVIYPPSGRPHRSTTSRVSNAKSPVAGGHNSPGVGHHFPRVGDTFPLRLGSRGKEVERLQVWLLRNYGWSGTINGCYDEKTDRLVKRFLKREVVDEATYRSLEMDKPVHHQRPVK